MPKVKPGKEAVKFLAIFDHRRPRLGRRPAAASSTHSPITNIPCLTFPSLLSKVMLKLFALLLLPAPRASTLGHEIDDLKKSLQPKPDLLALVPDVQIYYNAVRYALDDNIFYTTNDFSNARKLLDEGQARARALRDGQAPWNSETGLIVRGYKSKVDGSIQPYGLVVPRTFNPSANHQHRLDFWYHGRNVKLSELAFIHDREHNRGEFTPSDTFVLHPYGRLCNANKFVGEVDTFEALENVRKHYPIDENRISVRGFSMGGAATWHIGAHYASLWAAISPGAGFVDTYIFQKVQRWPTQPPW